MGVERVPLRVPHARHSIRLQGFDYSRAGTYFVTICVRMGDCIFGDVVAGRVRLNTAGRTAAKCWLETPTHFPNVTLDAFVVMPNHLHGILVIDRISTGRADIPVMRGVGAQHAAPLHFRDSSSRRDESARVAPGSLGAIVRSFKSATTQRINQMRRTPGEKVWQRNYYDRIIRNEAEFYRARGYILSNPDRWTRRANA